MNHNLRLKEEIVQYLLEKEAKKTCIKYGILTATIYRWKKEYRFKEKKRKKPNQNISSQRTEINL